MESLSNLANTKQPIPWIFISRVQCAALSLHECDRVHPDHGVSDA